MKTSPPTDVRNIATNRITAFGEPGRGDTNDPQLDSLIKSIGTVGLLHPITVTPDGDDYALLAGARRLAAARALDWPTIPAQIMPNPTIQEKYAIAAVENLDRKQLEPLDEAMMLQSALDQFDTPNVLAIAINRSFSWVQSRLDILTWPDDCIDALRGSNLSMSAIRPLASIPDDQARDFYLTEAVRNGANSRTTSAWAKSWQDQASQSGAVGHVPSLPSPIASKSAAPPSGACLSCQELYNLNELSHMPFCHNCLQQIRDATASLRRPPDDKQSLAEPAQQDEAAATDTPETV